MVAEAKFTGPIEPGNYIIRGVQSSRPLNLVCKEVGADPVVCIWDTVRSPTQKWCVEYGDGAYVIRNAASNHNISLVPAPPKVLSSASLPGPPAAAAQENGKTQDQKLKSEAPPQWTKLKVIGSRDSHDRWIIEKDDLSYFIRSASNTALVLDVEGSATYNSAHLIACDDFHKWDNQRWIFQKVDDVQPPSYSRRCYIGPIPPGIYSVEARTEIGKGSDKLPDKRPMNCVLGLGVTARLPLDDDESADIHLGPIGNGPWPHQIWSLESGRRGYRIKNMGIGAYISYVDSNIILENVEDGPLSVTEWVLVRMPNSRPRDLFEAHVRPSANAEVMLGITRDILSKLEVKSGDAWTKKLEESTIFNQWSFNAVKETFLNVSDHLH